MKVSLKKFIIFPVSIMLAFSVACEKSNDFQSMDSVVLKDNEISLDNTTKKKTGNTDIVYALWNTPDIKEQKLIDEFNNSDNGYNLVIKDYSEYLVNESDDENLFTSDSVTAMNIQMTKDITDGIIDVVSDHSFADSVYYEKLLKQNAFSDLYGFMRDDGEINTASLNEHVLSIHEIDGKLCVLPIYYTINTIMGETRYVGNNENWTLEDMISHWNVMPSGATINGKTEKNYIYYALLRDTLGSYVNYETAEVYFDSESFKKALEFCNSFDPVSSYKGEHDTNDVNFIFPINLAGFSDFHIRLYNNDNEQMTFVGYPSNDGNGSYINSTGNRYSICSTSSTDKQNGAWQFIRMLAAHDYQSDYYIDYYEEDNIYSEEHGFPINNAVFDEMANESKMGKFMESALSFNGVEKEVGLLNDEEINRLKEFINTIDTVYTLLDSDLDEIIESELMAYFNGEKTVDEAIKMIQNRASIMINEKL